MFRLLSAVARRSESIIMSSKGAQQRGEFGGAAGPELVVYSRLRRPPERHGAVERRLAVVAELHAGLALVGAGFELHQPQPLEHPHIAAEGRAVALDDVAQ